MVVTEVSFLLKPHLQTPLIDIQMKQGSLTVHEETFTLDLVSNLTATVCLDCVEEMPLSRSLSVDVDAVTLQLDPQLLEWVSACSRAGQTWKEQVRTLLSQPLLAPLRKSTQRSSSPRVPFVQFSLGIKEGSATVYSHSASSLGLTLSQFQASALITDTLQLSLSLLDLALFTETTTFLRRHTVDSPLLMVALEDHSLSAEILGLQVEIPSSLFDLLRLLQIDWVRPRSSGRSRKSEPGELAKRLQTLLCEKYTLDVSVQDLSVSFSDLVEDEKTLCLLSSNADLNICIGNKKLLDLDAQLFGLTCSLQFLTDACSSGALLSSRLADASRHRSSSGCRSARLLRAHDHTRHRVDSHEPHGNDARRRFQPHQLAPSEHQRCEAAPRPAEALPRRRQHAAHLRAPEIAEWQARVCGLRRSRRHAARGTLPQPGGFRHVAAPPCGFPHGDQTPPSGRLDEC